MGRNKDNKMYILVYSTVIIAKQGTTGGAKATEKRDSMSQVAHAQEGWDLGRATLADGATTCEVMEGCLDGRTFDFEWFRASAYGVMVLDGGISGPEDLYGSRF